MKYLKLFKQELDYQSFKNSSDYITPNVSLIEKIGVVYNPYEEPFGTDILSEGVFIYGIDNRFYTSEEWIASGKSNDQAVGVVVSKDEHSFVIHPTAECESVWSDDEQINITGINFAENPSSAIKDFSGELNTQSIINALNNGVITSAPAAQYCVNTIFANGKSGYLPSVGELHVIDQNAVNDCLTAIGGVNITLNRDYYWSSTQNSNTKTWAVRKSTYPTLDYNNSVSRKVRPITSL